MGPLKKFWITYHWIDKNNIHVNSFFNNSELISAVALSYDELKLIWYSAIHCKKIMADTK